MNNWFSKLKTALSKTSSNLGFNLKKSLSLNKPNKQILHDIEEVLLTNDLGVNFASHIVDQLSKKNFQDSISMDLITKYLLSEITSKLKPYEKQLIIPQHTQTYTILFSGANGSGKTTSLGKLAYKLCKNNKKVLIAACDTFRASATEQLIIWAQKSKCQIITGPQNSDPASIAYTAAIKAKKENFDVLLIDTAGRMHNKIDLMNELKKINKVLEKIDKSYPNLNLIVIDSNIGQIAIKQVENFTKIININGVIITKLDGTSKAGIIVPITQKFMIPIYFIGIGERIEDLNTFSAEHFAKALLI